MWSFMKGSLFYYTSNFVLKEWFKNETLWATRSITSNDKMDTVYIVEHFKELQEYLTLNTEFSSEQIKKLLGDMKQFITLTSNISLRVLKDLMLYAIRKDYNCTSLALNEAIYKSNNSNDKNVIENFYKSLVDTFQLDELSEIFKIPQSDIDKEFIKDIITEKYPYVICFSQEPDNRFFWDSYTNNEGVCLEFSGLDLYLYLSHEYARSYVCEISYDKQKQFEEMKRLINSIVDKKQIRNHDVYKKYYNSLSNLSAMFKHPYWQVENEVRAVFAASYFNDKEFQVKENYKLKYKNEYETQDYVEINIPKAFIKNITLGPINSKENIEQEILEYFGDKITESKGKGIIKTI